MMYTIHDIRSGAILILLRCIAPGEAGMTSSRSAAESGGTPEYGLGPQAMLAHGFNTGALFLCVGVYEELLFRGYQIRNAAEGLNFPVVGPRNAVILAWVLSSAFFGYLHADNPNATLLSTLNITLAGMMLGLGYALTGELAIPIGLHISWNFFQGNVFDFAAVSGLEPVGATFLSTEGGGPGLWTGGPFGPEAGLLGPAAMILGSILIALWVRLRSGKLAIHAPIAGDPHQH
jgi:uncharacterized protein